MTKVDLSGVSELEALPAGMYPVVLESAEVLTSNNSGKPYVKLTFSVNDGENEGRKLYANRSLQPQALWVLKKTLGALGVNESELAGEFDLEELLGGYIGAPAVLKVTQTIYNNKVVNNVDDVKPYGMEFNM